MFTFEVHGNKYGSFSSKEGAYEYLRRQGWTQAESDPDFWQTDDPVVSGGSMGVHVAEVLRPLPLDQFPQAK